MMKRRGLQQGSVKRRAWQEEQSDVESLASDASLGEKLPSEEEEPTEEAPPEEPAEPEAEEPAGPNPIVWLRMQVGEKLLPPIYLELFADVAPKCVENFRILCRGELAHGDEMVGYEGCIIHRIVSGFVAQGGDFEKGDGTGGFSIYGKTFPSEGFALTHARAGLLSMANSGPDTNGSQFFITLGAAPHLDHRHVVFGQVLSADAAGEVVSETTQLSPLRYLDAAGTAGGATRDPVFVASCGECGAAQLAQFASWLKNTPEKFEPEADRYARAKFSMPPLGDAVTEGNASEVLSIVEKQIARSEKETSALSNDEEQGMKLAHRCEQLEVGLTRLLLLLDDIDFRTLGETRQKGKDAQQRVRKLAVKLAKIKESARQGVK
jgi:cyclophilin family peptidyl-prolyl cis-trans isomerase